MNIIYPEVPRDDSIIEDFHGTPVADPYRWLEDADSAETQSFIQTQSTLTQQYLSEIPAREQIRSRLTELLNYERRSSLSRKGDYYYFWRNDGLQNQPLLCRMQTLDSEAQVVIDPNTFSEDGTTAVMAWSVNKDGTKIAYVITEGGSDWQKIRVRNVATGEDLDETLNFARFPSIAWHPNGEGFFYNGHTDPADRPAAEKNTNNKLFWHKLNTSQADDTIVYERPDEKEWNFPPTLTDDEAYLVSTVWYGAINRNRVYYRPIDQESGLIPLIDEADAEYRVVGNVGMTFYIQTDLNAPNKRIVAIDLENPARENWREVVAEQTDAIAFANLINGQFVIVYLHNAHHHIRRISLEGKVLGNIELPTLGTVLWTQGKAADSEFFLDFYSFLYPITSLRYDFASDELTAWQPPKIDFSIEDYETKQIFARSKDGTRVPVFVTFKKGIDLDGSHPTILYGYGGFSINLTPRFSATYLQWLEMGGIFAQAVLRGGSEFGEAWHKAGMLENKQNVFDDFIGAAETLVNFGYTSTNKLAIQGGSNGGLLVAACMIQRPKLYGAVICQVPVIDMLRYHKYTAGRYWIPEYGNAEESEQYPFMIAYSPLHNIKNGEVYPPTLILTADKDDRVVPMHAHKFAAALQYADDSENPLLLRFEFKAGHGFGKSTAKIIDEATDIYTFLHKNLG